MKKSEQEKQNVPLDDDIMEGKKDVLRAKDIIPTAPSTTQEGPGVLPLSVSQKTRGKTKIPQLDLAEKIMPKQRRISSVRRKAPDKNNKSEERFQSRSHRYILDQSTLTNIEENHLIAQIVARDIKRLLQDE